MRPVIEVWIPGVPRGKPAPRAYAMHGKDGKAHARMYKPATTDAWKQQCYLALRPVKDDLYPILVEEDSPFFKPVVVDLTFYMPRPKRLMRKKDPPYAIPCPAKPDGDNLVKEVLDLMTDLCFWRDDAQVIGGRWLKLYVAKGGATGCFLRLYAVDPTEDWTHPVSPLARQAASRSDTQPRGQRPRTGGTGTGTIETYALTEQGGSVIVEGGRPATNKEDGDE